MRHKSNVSYAILFVLFFIFKTTNQMLSLHIPLQSNVKVDLYFVKILFEKF
jgi:hypothetical protein